MQRNVLEYLENSANLFPQKVAYADENSEVTFEGLKNSAMQLGTAIANMKSAVNRPIAILVDRDVQSLIGFMGILYSGNYYVPIDNKMPLKRMESVLEQLQPELMIHSKKDAEIAQNFEKYSRLELETGLTTLADESLLRTRMAKILDIDPVYIIFTSGSTGVPKGIVVTHRGVVDLIDWLSKAYEVTNEDVIGNQPPFYFDASVKDIYLTLKCGASMQILPKKLFMFPTLLIDFLTQKKVTALTFATSAFHLVANSGVLAQKVPESLKKLLVAGETLHAKQLNIWKKALPNVQYINLYGPTEITVDCAYYKIEREFEDQEAIPIGIPCENKEIILLDEELKPVPLGEIGEICVRGTGLAKGYYLDQEKTKNAFIQNPLNPYYPDLIYRTGDLGRIGEDGLLYFETRRDGQIKHGGYRIEMGEIERALNSFDKVKVAVCLYQREEDKIVCVYEGEATDAEILAHIKALIPKYMFPNQFVKLENMPYNANGKVDRVEISKRLF